MDEFQMIKSTLASIKEYVSMRSAFLMKVIETTL
ncbi:hypothetical protein OKE_03771 [Enterococcus faecium EnGen0043]|nr:hypothetical protein OKE_03771 [Enterococcus faecium EnGen0043]